MHERTTLSAGLMAIRTFGFYTEKFCARCEVMNIFNFKFLTTSVIEALIKRSYNLTQSEKFLTTILCGHCVSKLHAYDVELLYMTCNRTSLSCIFYTFVQNSM